MTKRLLAVFASVAVLSLFAAGISPATAGDQGKGRQLMTQQERNEFQSRMRSAKTSEEQEQIRRENHQLMQERSKTQGGSGKGSGGGKKGK
jgi:hypothetical protein